MNKSEAPRINEDSSLLFFYRKLSAAGGTDQPVLSTARRQDKPDPKLKFKREDVGVDTRGGLPALIWKDRREVYMLTNVKPPPRKGNFCDDSNRPVKPHILKRYKVAHVVRRQF